MNDAVVEDNYPGYNLFNRETKNFNKDNKKISSARTALSKQQRKSFIYLI